MGSLPLSLRTVQRILLELFAHWVSVVSFPLSSSSPCISLYVVACIFVFLPHAVFLGFLLIFLYITRVFPFTFPFPLHCAHGVFIALRAPFASPYSVLAGSPGFFRSFRALSLGSSIRVVTEYTVYSLSVPLRFAGELPTTHDPVHSRGIFFRVT